MLKAGDSPLFNPSISTSLAGLKPFEGEIVENTTVPLGVAEANNKSAIFAIARVEVEVLPPAEQNLQTLLQRYGAKLINQFPVLDNRVFAVIEVDLSKIDISKLLENIQKMNNIITEPITYANFSSGDTSKTVAAFYEILVNSKDIVANAGLNYQCPSSSESTFTTNANSFNTKSKTVFGPRIPSPVDGVINTNEGSNKTLKDQAWVSGNDFPTNIRKALSYSAGYDTTIAIIDRGFGMIDKYSDFQNRVIYKPEFMRFINTKLQIYCDEAKVVGVDSVKYHISDPSGSPSDKVFSSYLEYLNKCYDEQASNIGDPNSLSNPPEHGFNVTSFIASGIDDFSGIGGIAPGVKILPMSNHDGNMTDTLNRLIDIILYIRENPGKRVVDVVNMSTGGETPFQNRENTNFVDNAFTEVGNEYIYYKKSQKYYNNIKLVLFQKIINILALDLNVIVVASAGNFNKPLSLVPALCDNEISVGAYSIENGKMVKANFSLKSEPGSNYGGSVDIWAPGTNLYNLKPNGNKNPINSSQGLEAWGATISNSEGTSFSGPIISAVIALLRSWNPNLTSSQVLKILQDTGYPLTDDSFLSSKGEYAINVEAAVTHSLVQDKPAIEFIGLFNSDNSITVINSVFSNSIDKILPTQDYTKIYPELIGKNVFIKGWLARDRAKFSSNLSSNPESIELLQMREYIQPLPTPQSTATPLPNQTPTPIPTSIPGSILSEVITDENWKWTAQNSNIFNPVVIVQPYLSKVTIPDTHDGLSVLPVWSVLTSSGTATCDDCVFDFIRNYTLPDNSNISSAKIDVQVDDTADIYINNTFIGRTNYISTFGANTYVTFNVPASLLHTGDNIVRIKLGVTNAPTTDLNNNFAAIAAKLSIFLQ